MIMNYSTLKKTVALSLATAFALSVNAQQDSTATTTTSTDSTSMAMSTDSTTTGTAKVFGGRGQYRSWNFGINGGVTMPSVIIGGTNDFNKRVDFGEVTLREYYGISLRKQLGHSFGLQLDAQRGRVFGYNKGSDLSAATRNSVLTNGFGSFETKVQYDVSLSGVVNVATIDFLRRENSVNFFVSAGYGLIAYDPIRYVTYADGEGTEFSYKGTAGGYGDDRDKDYIKQVVIPVGAGVKFKLSDRVALNLGYTMKFIDGDNFDGVYANGTSKDKFSYSYAGLEFSLGSKNKANLDWVNPVAVMYDELKDPTLRQEVEALKGRVTTVEQAVEDLKKDTDGDGVSDQFDKEPNTEAGAKVDGAGRTLDTDGDGIPDHKDDCPTEKGTAELNGCPAMGTGTMAGYENIQFEFNSSVLRTSSYPTLDKLSADMRKDAALRLQLDGHASEEGTTEYNQQLSVDRANAVKTYLVNSGVDTKKIAVKGFGETRPIASNETEEGRSQNRRVEFRKN